MMAITNGYCTLIELKQRLLEVRTYTAATISFTSSGKIVTDTAKGLRRFQVGDTVQISGSTSNDGYYTVATGDSVATFTVSEALSDEAAGDTVTITQVQDQVDDAVLESVVEGISRAADNVCGRWFYKNGSDETRYFTGEFVDVLHTPDLVSITTLKTDEDGDRTYERTWAATDYDLMPFNAALDNKPYTKIEITPSGNYSFPTLSKSVEIAGVFGWPAVPAQVKEATLLMGAKLFRRKDAIFGIVGTAGGEALVQMMKVDPEVMLLLDALVKVGVWG